MGETKIDIDFKNQVINVKNHFEDNETADDTKSLKVSKNVDYANQVIRTIREDGFDVKSIISDMKDILYRQGDIND